MYAPKCVTPVVSAWSYRSSFSISILVTVLTRAVEVPKKKAVKKAPLTGASGAF